jgi:hypothetical protein
MMTAPGDLGDGEPDDSELTRCGERFTAEVMRQLVRSAMLTCSRLDHAEDVTIEVSPQVWRVVEPNLTDGYLTTPLDQRVRVVPGDGRR